MNIRFFSIDLAADDERRSEAAIRQFPRIAQRWLPEATFEVSRLPDDLVGVVREAFAREADVFGCLGAASELLFDLFGSVPKLVVSCATQSELARKAMARLPHARWGVTTGGLAIIYRHEPTVVWHEMLHLLGAEDCYKVGRSGRLDDHTCGHENCLMQHEPTIERVSEVSPFLCKKNVALIKERWAAMARNRNG